MKNLRARFAASITALRTPFGISAAAFVALAIFVVWHGRQAVGLAAFTTDHVATMLITGIAIGALSALYATGIVVVYTTTGIFNFAQAAIGAFAAFLYWQLRVDWNWPALPALAVVVLGVAPLLGVALDRLIMRKLEGAPLVIQLLVTVGVMYFILTATGQIWKQDRARKLVAFYGTKSFDVGPINITYHRAIVLVVAIAIAISLRILFRSSLGVAMRAVVDNRDLAGLSGTNPDVVSAVAWAIGAMLGAIAGIMIAPELELDPANLNAVLVLAFAAAAFGQMRKLSLTLIGALLIGIARQFMRSFLRFSDWQFASDAIAPVVLLFVVVALPQSRLEVGRIARNLKRRERTTRTWEAVIGGAVLLLVFVALSGGWLNLGFWDPGPWNQIALNRSDVALSLAVVGMSLVPLTGWAGQLNFAPMAFAGFGAFLLLKLANGDGATSVSVWWLPVIGLLCAPLGALVALTAARLRGLYLALASIAFAQLMALLLFPHPRAGFRAGAVFKPFTAFGLNLSGRRAFMLLVVTVFVIFMIGLVALRRTRYGRRWVALHDSEAASATVGVSVTMTKVVVYAVSAAMAGVGGALFATASGTVDGVRTFTLDSGIPLVLLMAIGGIAFPIAALFTTFQLLTLALGDRLHQAGAHHYILAVLTFLRFFGPGLGAIGMVANPRGAAFAVGRNNARFLPWRRDAKQEWALAKAKKREPEIGELGLTEPFRPSDLLSIERKLGIVDQVALRSAPVDTENDTENENGVGVGAVGD
jgi:branched-chain amino acid transport system permease protein